ncbi:glutamate-1-semialdehyde 2,1-aminomutase [Lentisphaerota bacterium WC36G]|nr:glutamate-1-semialdehyde 2,1-aminomutase [Lentisphaerae bacterium WC36]
MKKDNSKKLFVEACKYIPGGVNSPVRAFNSVETDPVFIKKGKGVTITDVDGNEYTDFCGSWGPLILGHANDEVISEVQKVAADGLSFGTCNPLEVEMAELFCSLVPHADMVRMVSSGTEAVMTALRLARGVTNRRYIIKFNGNYHGHSDSLLVAAGSGLLTNNVSSSKGVTEKTVSEIIVLEYNDLDAVAKAFDEYKDEIAAVIVEPVAGNMGLIQPQDGFLKGLRELCTENGSCLIFDEVINGFRFYCGSFASVCGITPDISTFGKIIGGGMPVGAVCASKEIMEHLAPMGEVYQAGTLSGNPVALAAGIKTLEILKRENPYPQMAELAEKVATEINDYAKEKNVAINVKHFMGVFTIFFTNKEQLVNLNDVKECDTKRFAEYFRFMLDSGFYVSPSQFELNFVSAVHSEVEIDKFIATVKAFIDTL